MTKSNKKYYNKLKNVKKFEKNNFFVAIKESLSS